MLPTTLVSVDSIFSPFPARFSKWGVSWWEGPCRLKKRDKCSRINLSIKCVVSEGYVSLTWTSISLYLIFNKSLFVLVFWWNFFAPTWFVFTNLVTYALKPDFSSYFLKNFGMSLEHNSISHRHIDHYHKNSIRLLHWFGQGTVLYNIPLYPSPPRTGEIPVE